MKHLTLVYLIILMLLLMACSPAKKTASMEFTNAYLEFPATTAVTKGRAYIYHGFYGDLSYYQMTWGQDLVQSLNAQGYDVIGLTYPMTDVSFWNDGGVEYRAKLDAYVTWAINDVETKFGAVPLNIVGGISLGGLHAMITFSDFNQKFDGWFGAVPVTHLSALSEFDGVAVPHFDAINEEANLALKPGFLLWGTADTRVNFQYTIDLDAGLNAMGAPVMAISVPGMIHTTNQPVIDDIANWASLQ